MSMNLSYVHIDTFNAVIRDITTRLSSVEGDVRQLKSRSQFNDPVDMRRINEQLMSLGRSVTDSSATASRALQLAQNVDTELDTWVRNFDQHKQFASSMFSDISKALENLGARINTNQSNSLIQLPDIFGGIGNFIKNNSWVIILIAILVLVLVIK